MKKILKEMHLIERNAKNVNNPMILKHMNTKYRELERDLKSFTNNLDVIYQEI